MPPTTKSKTDKWLIGQPESVLKSEYILSVKCTGDQGWEEMYPFEGKFMLPTKMEILKLYWFEREEVGLFNYTVSRNDLLRIVAKTARKYWDSAGYPVVKRVEEHVKRLVDGYDSLRKKKSKKN